MKKIIAIFCGLITLCSAANSKAQVNIGDTIQFYSVSYIDWPPLWGTPQRMVNAICKGMGDHCYIMVEDSATQPSQANIDTLISRFDNNFYPRLTALYGPMPDVFDNDSNVFILAMNENDWAGYFDPGQQMADTFVFSHWSMHSNQKEMIYMAANYFGGAPGIVAHELGHLLHWQQDHSPYPAVNPVRYWEDAWIDEGFSTFAAEYLTHNVMQQGVMHNNAYFANNPDIPLIYFSDYDQVLLRMLFMYEHFGHDQWIKTLIKEQADGIQGVENALDSLGYSESFDETFEQWIVANYIDDPLFEGGKYSYFHFNFPAASNTAIHNTYPTGVSHQTVTPYGADYIVFNAAGNSPVKITFNGDSTTKFRLAFILYNTTTSAVSDVISLQPDQQNTLEFNADSFGLAYNRIIMAVMCVDATLGESATAGYAYHADSLNVGLHETGLNKCFEIFPNPASDKLIVKVDNIPQIKILFEILTISGQIIKKGNLVAGKNQLDISALPSADYMIRIYAGKDTISKKFVVKK